MKKCPEYEIKTMEMHLIMFTHMLFMYNFIEIAKVKCNETINTYEPNVRYDLYGP